MKDGDLTYQIIGCSMRVHTALRPGLCEKPYENALAIELEESGLDFLQQPSYPIFYKNRPVGHCQPDLMIADAIVAECKSIPSIGDSELGQMLNYLRITKKTIGLIINFRNGSLEHKRVQYGQQTSPPEHREESM